MTKKIAIAWLKQTVGCPDIDPQMMPSYDRYLAKMDSTIAGLEKLGIEAVKIDIDPETVLTWCTVALRWARNRDRHTRPNFYATRHVPLFE